MMFGWIILGIIVVVIVVRGFGRHSRRQAWMQARQNQAAGKPGNAALDMLNQRYAKGEIGKDEYEQKKKDLSA